MIWQAAMASNRHIQAWPPVREKMVARLKVSLEDSQFPSCCKYA
jgi:hypothetical protein